MTLLSLSRLFGANGDWGNCCWYSLCRTGILTNARLSFGGSSPIFSQLGMRADRAICFACFKIIFIITRSPIISGSTRPIFAIFSPYQIILVQMIDLNLFFNFSTVVAMSTNFVAKSYNFYKPLFVVLSFRNALKYWGVDGRINSGDDQAICGVILVGFWPVIPEFMRLNSVQQASISTRVSSSTIARGRHCQAMRRSVQSLFLCYSLGGRHMRRQAGYMLGFVMLSSYWKKWQFQANISTWFSIGGLLLCNEYGKSKTLPIVTDITFRPNLTRVG